MRNPSAPTTNEIVAKMIQSGCGRAIANRRRWLIIILRKARTSFDLLCFAIQRLIKLNDDVAWHLEMRHEAEPLVRYRLGELDAAGLQFGDRLLDVVAI